MITHYCHRYVAGQGRACATCWLSGQAAVGRTCCTPYATACAHLLHVIAVSPAPLFVFRSSSKHTLYYQETDDTLQLDLAAEPVCFPDPQQAIAAAAAAAAAAAERRRCAHLWCVQPRSR